MEEKFPHLGVAAYALMAAGGDFGASVAPQLLGVVVDSVEAADWTVGIADTLSLAPRAGRNESGYAHIGDIPACRNRGSGVDETLLQKARGREWLNESEIIFGPSISRRNNTYIKALPSHEDGAFLHMTASCATLASDDMFLSGSQTKTRIWSP